MGLVATRLELKEFRSYHSFLMEPDPALTVIVGPNAVGKTNIIEALQLLTAAESFRKPQWGDVVHWGETETRITLCADGDGRSLQTELRVGQAGKRQYLVNGKTRRRISDVAGILPCVLFTPDDLRLVKESADRRRGALDSLGVQLSPSYRVLRSDLERLLKQRNASLRDPARNQSVLEALTIKMVDIAAAFVTARYRLFKRLSPLMSELYGTLSHGETLKIDYLPSWGPEQVEMHEAINKELLIDGLTRRSHEEQVRGTTLVGPHKDDVSFKVNGRDARSFASQGQQRTIALAWKLAEVGVVKDVCGQAPLLLLDDVMSELDEERRHSLASFVGGAAQTLMTTTNLGYFDEGLVNRAKVVHLP